MGPVALPPLTDDELLELEEVWFYASELVVKLLKIPEPIPDPADD